MDTSDREPEPMKNPVPPEAGPVRSYGWEWGREEDRRPRLPWIGVFLVVYGALLLVEKFASGYFATTNLVVLAAGLAFLIAWMVRRGTFTLYAGAFLTASAVPGLLKAATGNEFGSGLGTLCYGVALLFIAVVRLTRGGGIGWQALIGVILVALGASELALPDATSVVLPILLVAFGLVLLTRDRRPDNWRG